MLDIKEIEAKWQKKWEEAHLFESDRIEDKEKYFGNFPFPYINGKLHWGHGYSMMKLEATIRFQRMLGKNVLWPFGFHATGEPIVGMAKRVAKGDKKQIQALLLSGVKEEEIEKYADPYNIIRHFMKTTEDTCRSLGVAVDWRRKFVTTQLTPVFSKFIEWQYRRLFEKGYVVKASHPVIYCPSCGSPTGDHDRLEGEGARIVEFVLIKFFVPEFNAYLAPGTIRPETTFGVTNIFLHPEAKYVIATVNGEALIVEEHTVPKLRDQEYDVTDVTPVAVAELFGKVAINPLTGENVPILPAKFIDPEGASGVVMSVPAHAPVDYATLVEIQTKVDELEPYGIKKEDVLSIKPISLITIEGFGEFPAKEVVEQMGISGQDDPKLKEATKLVYRKEAMHGITKPITGKYKGKPVEQVKEELIKDMIEEKKGLILKEPNEVVICRCGTRNYVKHVKDQWFLKFGDPKWKKKVYKMIDKMTFYPPELKKSFINTVDWLENKACVRRSGLGTPAPWDPEWIIETLSDSVIYMAYYLVSKYVNEGSFKESYATDEVFDYIYLGKGNATEISKAVGIDKKLLREIRKDVEYWYGFDIRSSGKDLINNHLTYMLFHHAALFPEKYWPKAIHVNGYVKTARRTETDEIVSERMSKSKGNFKTLDDLVEAFGADIARVTLMTAGEGLEDASVMVDEIESYEKWIHTLYQMAVEQDIDDEMTQIDRWLISKMQKQIQETRENFEQIKTRSAFQSAFHIPLQLVKWYLNRRGGSKGPAYRYVREVMVKMIVPFMPHICEEIWQIWGNEGFISNEAFPEANEEKIDLTAEYAEKYLGEVMDDLRGLVTFLTERGHPQPSNITLYVSPEWKYKIYMEAMNGMQTLMKNIMQDPEIKKRGKEAVKYAQTLLKSGTPPDMPISFELEMSTLTEAIPFIERQIGAKVQVLPAEGVDHPKALAAIPRRPGIVLE